MGIHQAPSRTACRSLAQSVVEPHRHERFMEAALADTRPSSQAEAGGSRKEASGSPPEPSTGAGGTAAQPGSGTSASSSSSRAGSELGTSLSAADEFDAEEEDRLLAEAAAFGAADEDTDG